MLGFLEIIVCLVFALWHDSPSVLMRMRDATLSL